MLDHIFLGIILKCISNCIKNKEFGRAICLCNKLIDNNIPEGFAFMGRIYSNGYGVDIDLSKSEEYYYRATEMGIIWAVNELFDVLWRHNTKTKDEEAISLIMPFVQGKIVNGGGMARLGRAYRYGRGVPKDYDKSKELLKQAAALDSRWMVVYNDLFSN